MVRRLKGKKNNTITNIQDPNGFWWSKEDGIEIIILSYFRKIFSSSGSVGENNICEVIKNRITDENKNLCNLYFTPDDVKEAFSYMAPLKALGLDSIPALMKTSIGTLLEKISKALSLTFSTMGKIRSP